MITLVDYGDACIPEIKASLEKITDDFIISKNEIDICRSDKIIFAGCGNATEAMKKIHLLNLFSVLRIVKKPMLGIGLGMQLMTDYSKEGNFSCLGFFSGFAVKFDESILESTYKGLQKINYCKPSLLFNGIEDCTDFYFNNSFYIPINNLATSSSGKEMIFCASMENGNSFGVQFHPEKSGEAGLRLLKNFIEM
jgi:glutamine amidotransferase